MKNFRMAILMVVFSLPSFAQGVVGKWELKGSYLELGYSLQWKILTVKTPRTGFKSVSKAPPVEFHEDGRIRMGNTWGTYTLAGNRLRAVFGIKEEEYDFQANGNQLTLWLENIAVGLSSDEAKAKAIMMAKQMQIHDQFPNLEQAAEVYSIRIGMALEYAGTLSAGAQSSPAGRTETLPSITSGCSVTDADLERITGKAEEIGFDSDKLKFLQSAVISKKCFTSEQIRGLLGLLTFDKEKLPLARLAYRYVTDPDNYYELEDVFDFEDSKAQFQKLIQSRK